MVVTATSFIKCEQHVVVTIKMSDRKKAGKPFFQIGIKGYEGSLLLTQPGSFKIL